ncbi:MAG: hypothetical protein JO257_00880 [Deltaproteobacteria bacterium]|nr:hypothetical protein [Deltaproteobacteria bacterium]
MRIPASVIVMSLVTAVPFALAVRDTMKPHTKTLDEMTDEEREAHFEEEMRKEAEQDAQREAARTAKREQTFKTFFGNKPAQLGTYFGGVHFGMSSGDPAIAALPLNDEDARPYIGYDGAMTINNVRIPGEDHCDTLHDAMVKAWGDSPDGVYLDPASHVRAKYSDCEVNFDRYLEVNEWLDKKDSAPAPLTLVGKPLEKLQALVPHADQDDGEIMMWTVPGIGRGTGPARVTATIENDKVSHVSISVVTDAPTIDAVKARLVGMFGKGTTTPDDPDTIEWKGKGRLYSTEDSLTIDLGKD